MLCVFVGHSVWQGVVGTKVIGLFLCLLVRLSSSSSSSSGQAFCTSRLPKTAHPIRRSSRRSHGTRHTSHLNHSAIRSWPDAPGLYYCQISLSVPGADPKTQIHICTLLWPAIYAMKALQSQCQKTTEQIY